MIILLQRVAQASVTVADKVVGSIAQGILAFVAFEQQDKVAVIAKMLNKMLNYRMFNDDFGKMNLSLRDMSGGLLLVSQFTLAANTNSGLRASLAMAMSPELAAEYFAKLVTEAKILHHDVASGQFGANMQVQLINDGPVTFLLNS